MRSTSHRRLQRKRTRQVLPATERSSVRCNAPTVRRAAEARPPRSHPSWPPSLPRPTNSSKSERPIQTRRQAMRTAGNSPRSIQYPDRRLVDLPDRGDLGHGRDLVRPSSHRQSVRTQACRSSKPNPALRLAGHRPFSGMHGVVAMTVSAADDETQTPPGSPSARPSGNAVAGNHEPHKPDLRNRVNRAAPTEGHQLRSPWTSSASANHTTAGY
jgi:hypothetical protein